jgi:membrane associated rhomboid family serine protease/Tfp pilus assembly protein PilF
MAKCTSCRKQFDAPFWKFASVCPECASAQVEARTKLKLLTPEFFVTPTLVGLNVLVFIAMVASGASIVDPDVGQLIRWGADYGGLSLANEPWRLLTAMFVHIGIIHILFNMWCLWTLGSLAERLMGNWNYLILYLLSGIGGGILSLWLHPQQVSAGASGAIFGVAGGMIALLALKKVQLPGTAVKQQVQSLLFFVGYNLLYGMRGGIDNAAHLGGLLAGAALGAFLPRRVPDFASTAQGSASSLPMSELPGSSRFKVASAAVVCILVAAFGFVRRSHGPAPNSSETTNLQLFRLKSEDRENLQDAAKAVQDGQTDDATIEKLKTVASHAPASSLAHIVLAEAYVQKKEYSPAIDEFHKANALQPDYAPGHDELGSALLQNGQNDQAIVEYRAVLRLDPKNANAHNNLGVALERTGDLRGSLEEYRAASTLDPSEEIYQDNFKRLSTQLKK